MGEVISLACSACGKFRGHDPDCEVVADLERWFMAAAGLGIRSEEAWAELIEDDDFADLAERGPSA